jgi:hypothetical protein
MKYTDLTPETPRLVVQYARPTPEKEGYQWGIVGQMPVLWLIGYITRVQAELAFRAPEECPESALVIAWDKDKMAFSYWIHRQIPVDSMVGFLETIKAALVGSQLVQQQRDQQIAVTKTPLLGPDGQPFRRR